VEVRQLRYFVAVAEELHFGRAAERLHVAQPAVSQQLGRLERELGVRLLERTSRRVALTGDGRRLLDEARAALSAVDRVRVVAADLVAGRAAVLRVGTTPGVGPRLSRAAAKLRAEVPDLTLTLVDGTLAAHVAALRAGELDIALVRGTVAARDLQARVVWRDPLQVMLPAAHPAAAGPTAGDRARRPHAAPARPRQRSRAERRLAGRLPRRRHRPQHRPVGAVPRGRRRRDRHEQPRRHGGLRLRGRTDPGRRGAAPRTAGGGARDAAHAPEHGTHLLGRPRRGTRMTPIR
jgi:DNA-binding transcriptional LysR family regulator